MAFWGVEVKPGKPYTHVHDLARGKLRLTQATLGNGTSPKRVIVQCNVGSKSPVLLCALLPEKAESFSLDIEFEEEEDVVLSVVGPRSVYLCGYFLGSCGHGDGDETDSYGEDIAGSESDESGSFDSEDGYEDDFIDDDDFDMFPPSPRPNGGVVIEEIIDEEKPVKDTNGLRRLRKMQHVFDSDDDAAGSECQIVLKQNHTEASESEDDDGFPISLSLGDKSDAKPTKGNEKSEKISDNGNQGKDAADTESGFQREIDRQSFGSSKKADTKSKKKKKEHLNAEKGPEDNGNLPKGGIGEETNSHQAQDANNKTDGESVVSEKSGKLQKKKKKKMKKGETNDNTSKGQNLGEEGEEKINEDKKDAIVNSPTVLEDTGKSNKKNKKKRAKSEVSQDGDETDGVNDGQSEGDRNLSISKSEKKQKQSKSDVVKTDGKKELVKEVTGRDGDVQSQQRRSFSNGLTIEELAMGKPDGQRASSGKKVSVHYIGKLQNGKIFDSNIGQRPFQFRLGVGQVIKGWDVGVNGMRIGDKRRLTIPPSMGYGSKNVGKIPANSILVFDVELVAVK